MKSYILTSFKAHFKWGQRLPKESWYLDLL